MYLKKYILPAICISILGTASTAKELLCSERDISLAISGFENRSAAESWFPPMIYLNPKVMNWLENDYQWYEDIKVRKHRENLWEFFDGSTKFTAEYDTSKRILSVKMASDSGIRNIPAAFYRKCEIVQSAGSLGGN